MEGDLPVMFHRMFLCFLLKWSEIYSLLVFVSQCRDESGFILINILGWTRHGVMSWAVCPTGRRRGACWLRHFVNNNLGFYFPHLCLLYSTSTYEASSVKLAVHWVQWAQQEWEQIMSERGIQTGGNRSSGNHNTGRPTVLGLREMLLPWAPGVSRGCQRKWELS